MKNYFEEIYNELDRLEKDFTKISKSEKINAKDIIDILKTIEFKKIEKKILDFKTFYSILK